MMLRLTGSRRTALIAALLLLANPARPDEPATKLINLGRLSITRVYASSVNGERPIDNAFYGVGNLFDGGHHIVNGINYSDWSSDDGPNWVSIRFLQPVTVTGLLLFIDRTYADVEGYPSRVRIMVRGDGPKPLLISHDEPIGGLRTIWAPAEPLDGVRNVLLLFDEGGIRVDELELYGPPPPGVDLTPVTPRLDEEMAAASPNSEAVKAARTALLRTIVESEIEMMRSLRSAIDQDSDPHQQAKRWLRLNTIAERLKMLLGDEKGTATLFKKGGVFGITLGVCQSSRYVGVEGYQKYLRLWPDGPDADVAWWKARVNGERCLEFEGTAEEYKATISKVKRFMAKFPKSQFIPEARGLILNAQKAMATAQE